MIPPLTAAAKSGGTSQRDFSWEFMGFLGDLSDLHGIFHGSSMRWFKDLMVI